MRLSDPSLPLNPRNATVVALGEKRILENVIASLEEALLDESMPLGVSQSGEKPGQAKDKNGKKRGRTSGDGDGSGKKEKKARR